MPEEYMHSARVASARVCNARQFCRLMAVEGQKVSKMTAFVHFSGRFLVKRGCFGQRGAPPSLFLLGRRLKRAKSDTDSSILGSRARTLTFWNARIGENRSS